MAYAAVSKTVEGNLVRVQLPPPAPIFLRKNPSQIMLKRIDGFQIFGVLTLLVSIFFLLAVARGSERLLFLGGIFYSGVLFFHAPLKQFIVLRTTHVLRAYGIAIFVNGMLMEVLAYFSSADRIRSGQEVFLFAPSSLFDDLISGLTYYITFVGIFVWALLRYDFSAFDLGVVIFLAQAMTVDAFTHLIQLFSGNVLGFLMAGLIMLFTFHAPIVLFSSAIKLRYPNRSRSFSRYPVVILLHLV